MERDSVGCVLEQDASHHTYPLFCQKMGVTILTSWALSLNGCLYNVFSRLLIYSNYLIIISYLVTGFCDERKV